MKNFRLTWSEGCQILWPSYMNFMLCKTPWKTKLDPPPPKKKKRDCVQYGCSFSLFIGLAVIACVIVSLILVILVILLKRTTAEARNNPIKTRWEIFRISWILLCRLFCLRMIEYGWKYERLLYESTIKQKLDVFGFGWFHLHSNHDLAGNSWIWC